MKLRASLAGAELEQLNKVLKSIEPPHQRMTLPVIERSDWRYTGSEETGKDDCIEDAAVKAIPSLGWSASDWRQVGSDGKVDKATWEWEIRYRHVGLSNNGNHKVLG